jgi:ABC-type protease/lipase transport system fused ATPase/permease subunit
MAVVVAHRTNVIGCVDQLLVLAEGRVQAFGPKDKVLSKLAPAQAAQPGALKVVTASRAP